MLARPILESHRMRDLVNTTLKIHSTRWY